MRSTRSSFFIRACLILHLASNIQHEHISPVESPKLLSLVQMNGKPLRLKVDGISSLQSEGCLPSSPTELNSRNL